MNEPRPPASLGAILLARKGAASPAIKAQVGAFGSADLIGDIEAMGQDHSADLDHNNCDYAEEPEIIRQQEVLASRIIQFGAAEKVSENPTADQKLIPARKVAFTLRLDQQRHLRLKLASTLQGTSAQQLVTQALDRFLAEMPQVESLAKHMKIT